MNSQKPIPYDLCAYSGTRLRFRGPAKSFCDPYAAVLGGTETFGPYVRDPYPKLLEDWLDLPVANLGVRQAGVSLFASEQWLIDRATQAELAVVQVLGAANMSNRLYSVHSRRNDRFLSVSPALREIFPDVDFTEFSFIRHMLQSLADKSQPGFEAMVAELRWAWVQRMLRVLACIEGEVILLWMSDRAPEDASILPHGPAPLFVTKDMLDTLASEVSAIVEVVAGTETDRLNGKHFAERERDAALSVPSPQHHAKVAEKLAEVILEIGGRRKSLIRARSKVATAGLARDRVSFQSSLSSSSGTAVNRSATRP